MKAGEAWTRAADIAFSASISLAIDGPLFGRKAIGSMFICVACHRMSENVHKGDKMKKQTVDPLIFSYYISWWFWVTCTCPRSLVFACLLETPDISEGELRQTVTVGSYKVLQNAEGCAVICFCPWQKGEPSWKRFLQFPGLKKPKEDFHIIFNLAARLSSC